MFSAVLIAALSATPSTPAWGDGYGYQWYGCYTECCNSAYLGYTGCGVATCCPIYSTYPGAVGYHAPFRSYGIPGAIVVDPKNDGPPRDLPKGDKIEKEDKKKPEVALPGAHLIVEVPADAKLFINDQRMQSTSSRRVFAIPTVDDGQSYRYQIRAEVIRNGKTYTDNREVEFRAGQTIKAFFAEPTAVVIGNAAQGTVTGN